MPAETFDEIGNDDAIRREVWDFSDRLVEALFDALFHADEGQDSAELLKTSVAQAVTSLEEHAAKWAEGEPLSKRFLEPPPEGIVKIDEDERLAFGFFQVSVNNEGETMVDLQGDIVEPAELEKAAYGFVLDSREGGDMHQGDAQATLVESFVVTPEKLQAMGIAKNAIQPRWWGGFHIPGDELWEQVKSGERPMFSVQGTAQRVEV